MKQVHFWNLETQSSCRNHLRIGMEKWLYKYATGKPLHRM